MAEAFDEARPADVEDRACIEDVERKRDKPDAERPVRRKRAAGGRGGVGLINLTTNWKLPPLPSGERVGVRGIG